ncbi:MAG: ribosomal protein methyltransferase [Actinomycetota bacterium]
MRTSRRSPVSRRTYDALTEPGGEWLLVDFETPREQSDLVSDALWSLGVVAIEEIDSGQDRVTLRTSLGAESSSGASRVTDRFPGVSVTPISFPASVADTWRRFVSPTHVVDDVWLVPQWCDAPEGRAIIVEPFDTFGLGNHPTTVLTLRSALRVSRPNDVVLDLGSGSGVLSVALACLVGSTVEAHDIAAQGEAALQHNAILNGCDGLVTWLPDVSAGSNSRYDIVMANILAPVLRQLAGDIQALVRPAGSVILSGLRDDQVDDVLEHYGECDVISTESLDGWAGVTLRRR